MGETTRSTLRTKGFAALWTLALMAAVAFGALTTSAPLALAVEVAETGETGAVQEAPDVVESNSASPEKAAVGDGGAAMTNVDDREIYAIFYDNPDKKSYTLVIQNGDTLDPAYPKPADDQVKLVCGSNSNGGYCSCDSWYLYRTAYEGRTTHAKVQAGVAPHSTQRWFEGFVNLESIDLSGLNTSEVTAMNNMFFLCESLESLDLSKFNTSEVTDTAWMFASCSLLKTLKLPEKFDTSKVTDMSHMFSGCTLVETLALSDEFDTARVTNMSTMFAGCNSLRSLDLTKFDTSKVIDMSGMFSGCSSLKALSFPSGFTTGWVTDMRGMFNGCSLLTSLDISGFDMTRVKTVDSMFSGCESLAQVSFPATGDFAKANLPDQRDDMKWGESLKWRNEKGEVFAANAIPARTAGTYTAVVVGSDSSGDSNGDGSGSDNGNGSGGNGDNSGSNNGNGGSNNGSGNGSGSANPAAPKRIVAFSEAVTLPLDATGVAMDKWDITRDLSKRFGSREGFPANSNGVAVTIMHGDKEVEAIDPTSAGVYEVTVVYSMPDGTERVIEVAYTVAAPAAKAPVKATVKSGTRLAQTSDEVTPAAPLATAALAACALAAAVAARRRARG